jgi:hypothetical protein
MPNVTGVCSKRHASTHLTCGWTEQPHSSSGVGRRIGAEARVRRGFGFDAIGVVSGIGDTPHLTDPMPVVHRCDVRRILPNHESEKKEGLKLRSSERGSSRGRVVTSPRAGCQMGCAVEHASDSKPAHSPHRHQHPPPPRWSAYGWARGPGSAVPSPARTTTCTPRERTTVPSPEITSSR